MKAVVQRTIGKTQIEYDKQCFSYEGHGLVALLGWELADEELTEEKLTANEEWLVSRIQGLRIFPDSEGKMNLSLSDYLKENSSEGGILWVPQFTLAAELKSGYRPSFVKAMNPEQSKTRFNNLVEKLNEESKVTNIYGAFGSDMSLSFTNWGPVTIPLSK